MSPVLTSMTFTLVRRKLTLVYSGVETVVQLATTIKLDKTNKKIGFFKELLCAPLIAPGVFRRGSASEYPGGVGYDQPCRRRETEDHTRSRNLGDGARRLQVLMLRPNLQLTQNDCCDSCAQHPCCGRLRRTRRRAAGHLTLHPSGLHFSSIHKSFPGVLTGR